MSESETDRTSSEQAEARRLEMIGLLRVQLAGILDDARTVWDPSPHAPGLAGQLAQRLSGSRALIAFRGHLMMDPGEGYRLLRQRFETLGYTPTLHREGDWEVVTALPAVFEQSQPQRPWINLLLFAATFLTTTIMGTLMEQGELLMERGLGLFLEEPWRLLTGIPMALTIMGILGLHELAHYFVARRHKLDTSLPYFIPVPFGLGTFGAIIRTRTPWENRNALFDVGVAGPIAGILVALPLFFLGLMAAEAKLPVAEGTPLGTPLLLGWMEDIVYQVRGINVEYELYISAWAFAAWFGVVISGFNLMPIGQLDGGHVTYSLLRDKARLISRIGSWVCVGLIYFSPSWILWAILVRVLGRRHPATLDDEEPIGRARVILGFIGLAVFVVCFVPNPIVFSWRDFFEAAGVNGLLR
jgi:Zn-dependent protease